MATKKAATTKKKATPKKSAVATTTTRVKTVKSVAKHPAEKAAVVHADKQAGASTHRPVTRNYTSIAAATIAEVIGTFILTAIILSQAGQPIPVMFGIIAAALGIGALSGSYMNPALVVGAWITRRLDGMRALFYIIGQICGALVAWSLIDWFTSASAPQLQGQALSLGQTATQVFHAAAIPGGKELLVLVAEFIGMFVFALIVASAISEKRKSLATALSIGTGLFAGLIVASSATSALLSAQFTGLNFLNPAVAIASGIFSSGVASVWSVVIYLIVPLVASALAFGLYELLRPGRYEQANR